MSLIIFLAASLLNYFLQLFTYSYDEYLFSVSGDYLSNGLIAGAVFFLFTGLTNIFVPGNFLENKWTVEKELVFWVLFFVLIGTANFYLCEWVYNNPENHDPGFFITEVFQAYGAGLLVVVLIVIANYLFLLNRTSRKADAWNELVHSFREKKRDDPEITLTSRNNLQDSVTFRLSDFIFARGDRKRVKICLREKDGDVSIRIIQSSLADVETQTAIYHEIKRVHPSYIVNVKKINSLSGNAQGYKLALPGKEEPVPVARKYIRNFEKSVNLHALN
ncbi:MAG: LytTR family DNA-binding domain-containing protein [Balneolaceae bacterium]